MENSYKNKDCLIGTNNNFNIANLLQLVNDIQDKLYDIDNVLQLLDVSLSANNDDKSIIRSVQLIDKMVVSVIEYELKGITLLCSDCESI